MGVGVWHFREQQNAFTGYEGGEMEITSKRCSDSRVLCAGALCPLTITQHGVNSTLPTTPSPHLSLSIKLNLRPSQL